MKANSKLWEITVSAQISTDLNGNSSSEIADISLTRNTSRRGILPDDLWSAYYPSSWQLCACQTPSPTKSTQSLNASSSSDRATVWKLIFQRLIVRLSAFSISGYFSQLDRTHPLPRAILTGWLFQRPVIFDVDYLRDSQNNLWFMCSCWVYIYHCLDRVGTATSCLYVAAVLGSLQGTDFHSSRFLIDKHDLWFHYFVFYDRIRSVESVLLLPISANQSGLFKNLLTYFGSHWLILCGFEVEL